MVKIKYLPKALRNMFISKLDNTKYVDLLKAGCIVENKIYYIFYKQFTLEILSTIGGCSGVFGV